MYHLAENSGLLYFYIFSECFCACRSREALFCLWTFYLPQSACQGRSPSGALRQPWQDRLTAGILQSSKTRRKVYRWYSFRITSFTVVSWMQCLYAMAKQKMNLTEPPPPDESNSFLTFRKMSRKTRRFSYFVTVRFLLFEKMSRKSRVFTISWHSRSLLMSHFVISYRMSANDCHETSEKPIFRDRFQKDLCGIVTNASIHRFFVTILPILSVSGRVSLLRIPIPL